MSKGYILGFGVVLALVGGAVDYDRMSKEQGVALGQIGAGEYFQSFKSRYDGVVEARADKKALEGRQAAEPRTHLAAAPEGWQRIDWTPDIEAWINGLTVAELEAWKKEKARKGGPMSSSIGGPTATDIKRKTRQGYIYHKGAQVVEVIATWKPVPKEQRGIMANTVGFINLAMNSQVQKGFAFIQGVPYSVTYSNYDWESEARAAPFKRISAQIGLQVEIQIRARTTDQAVRDILAGIDHAALNAMLDEPMPNVDPDMPLLTVDGQIQMAELAIEAERERRAVMQEEYQKNINGGLGMFVAKAPTPRTQATMDEEMRSALERQLGGPQSPGADQLEREARTQEVLSPRDENTGMMDRMKDFFKRPGSDAPAEAAPAPRQARPEESKSQEERMKEFFKRSSADEGQDDRRAASASSDSVDRSACPKGMQRDECEAFQRVYQRNEEELSARMAEYDRQSSDRAPSSPSKPMVSRLGGGNSRSGGPGNCTFENGVKRCRVGN